MMRESPVSVSPVPTEQQPLNEYEQLKDSCFFRWGTLSTFGYVRKLAWLWLWGWLVSGPIAAASFPPQKYSLQFALAGAGGSLFLLALVILRIYLGWSYVRDRLSKEIIFYEESGWYDGQNWQKPPEVINRDRLVVSYQINPILQRLRRTLALLALATLGGGLIWLVFAS